MRCHLLFIACVAIFAAGRTSNADIVYHPTNFLLGDVWNPEEEFFDLDLDSNGSVDFSLVASMFYFSGISSSDPNANKYLIHPSPSPNIGGSVAALGSDYLISSNSGEGTSEEWFALAGWDTFIYVLSTGTTGEFIDRRGYVGLEFEAEDGIHYGWLDIEGVQGGSSLRVRGWSYESNPGEAIVAGAIPEPGSVALFLVGGLGIFFLRKKQGCRVSFYRHERR